MNLVDVVALVACAYAGFHDAAGNQYGDAEVIILEPSERHAKHSCRYQTVLTAVGAA